ncbi:MAG: OmpH family outer membrane protein [Synergistaceae bacterium]|nr:OmpH family outer membrane protein [Synergistaceae bacterium]
MFSVRKIIVSVLAVLFLSLYISGAAFAQDVMGCVDPQKIMFQHPKFEQIQKQVSAVTNKKQEEAKVAIDKETDDKKKGQIFQDKRTEAANEERKLMEPLFKDINLAIRTVANTKKITVVVDKGAVFFGGTDITDDVIAELKKKK